MIAELKQASQGFRSFDGAWRTIQGYEVLHMIRKGAIQQFRAHRPDVTLMDLQMPEMNGLDALMAIRGEFPEARVIMITTYSGDVQVMRSMQVGPA